MALAHGSGELDDNLHTLDLALDCRIEVLLLHFWEEDEVNRPGITSLWVLRDERPQRLVNVLSQERRVR